MAAKATLKTNGRQRPPEPIKLNDTPEPKRDLGVLGRAHEIVYGRGEGEYGHPAVNFQEIADLWTTQLNRKLTQPITPQEVAALMISVKLARLINHPFHRDSLIDIAGYAETYDRVNKRHMEGQAGQSTASPE